MKKFIQKNLVPITLIAVISILAILTTATMLDVRQQGDQNLTARTENSGWKKTLEGGILTSLLDDSIVQIDLQGANLVDGGSSTFNTTTASALVTSTSAIISASAYFPYLTQTYFPIIGASGLLQDSTMTQSGVTTTIPNSLITTNLYSGLISMPEDGGLIDIMDIPVSATPAAATEQGYNFLIDGLSSFSVLREADSAGSVANTSTWSSDSFKCETALNLQGQRYWKYIDGASQIISTTTPCN